MVEVSLTVGKLDASLALLLTKDHHLIEFPTILLPDGISTGSIVKITCDRDFNKEKEEREKFNELQEEIFEIFGKHEPQNPILKIVNITQTSCVLEWEPLNLGTAELKELTLYKNGSKLGPVKNPFQKKNIKFSGLPIDTPYKFQLKLETSSGVYYSNIVELRTHKMTDLSGITVCIGDIDYNNEKFSLSDIDDAIKSIGAKPYSNQVKVDTTQFICTENSGIECQKAKNMNIPIIRPEWLKACQLERRIVGVNKFYLDAENPIWKTKDFWFIDDNALVPKQENGEIKSLNEHSVPDITIEPEEESEPKPEAKVDNDVRDGQISKSDEPIVVEDSVVSTEQNIEPAVQDVSEAQEAVSESVDETVKTPTDEIVEYENTEPVAESTEETAEEAIEVSTEIPIEEPAQTLSGEEVLEPIATSAEETGEEEFKSVENNTDVIETAESGPTETPGEKDESKTSENKESDILPEPTESEEAKEARDLTVEDDTEEKSETNDIAAEAKAEADTEEVEPEENEIEAKAETVPEPKSKTSSKKKSKKKKGKN